MQLPPLASLALAPAPLPLVGRAARFAFRSVMRRHPELADRLGQHQRKTFGFDGIDLPFAFLIRPAAGSIEAVRRLPPDVDAAVSGPIFALLALLEGRVDGDALFFSRELEITGDMEAILALRNALDDCGIDLPTELAASSGPLGGLVKAACERVRARVLERGAWN